MLNNKTEKKERLEKIMTILGPIFTDRKPFLDFENPFQLLVATVLSAQCMDIIVNSVTPELFRRFPNPESLMNAPLGEVERIIQKVGTYRAKAHNIKALSRMLYERHNSEVPASMEILTTMPGVGRKTANVVLSICFDMPAIVVDTHFMRITRRLGLTHSTKPEDIESDISSIAESTAWIDISNVLNRFGRAVCHAKKPLCDSCNVKEFCTGKQA